MVDTRQFLFSVWFVFKLQSAASNTMSSAPLTTSSTRAAVTMWFVSVNNDLYFQRKSGRQDRLGFT